MAHQFKTGVKTHAYSHTRETHPTHPPPPERTTSLTPSPPPTYTDTQRSTLPSWYKTSSTEGRKEGTEERERIERCMKNTMSERCDRELMVSTAPLPSSYSLSRQNRGRWKKWGRLTGSWQEYDTWNLCRAEINDPGKAVWLCSRKGCGFRVQMAILRKPFNKHVLKGLHGARWLLQSEQPLH